MFYTILLEMRCKMLLQMMGAISNSWFFMAVDRAYSLLVPVGNEYAYK